MPTILLIDDREDLRTTAAGLLTYALGDLGMEGWNVRDEPPPLELVDVRNLLLEDDDIAVLLTDHRLGEQPIGEQGSTAPYTGSALITYLRRIRPQLPMFVVSSYVEDDDTQQALDQALAHVDGTFSRTLLSTRPEEVVIRITRSGVRYFEQYTSIISELTQLAEIASQGETSLEQKQRIAELQQTIGIDLGLDIFATAADELRILSEHNERLAQKLDKLEEKLSLDNREHM